MAIVKIKDTIKNIRLNGRQLFVLWSYFLLIGFVDLLHIIRMAMVIVCFDRLIASSILFYFFQVMTSATGLEFAYTQAPPSMKSVVQSFWLLTTCFGNIIDIFLVEIKLSPTQVNGACVVFKPQGVPILRDKS